MKLLRSERGLVLALVVIGATIARIMGALGDVQYLAILTMCIQALLTYKTMPQQPPT